MRETEKQLREIEFKKIADIILNYKLSTEDYKNLTVGRIFLQNGIHYIITRITPCYIYVDELLEQNYNPSWENVHLVFNGWGVYKYNKNETWKAKRKDISDLPIIHFYDIGITELYGISRLTD